MNKTMYAIAIDGPSGAGKSTVAKDLARALHITYIDTGAMYRALGVTVLRANISTKDAANVAALLYATRIDLKHDASGQRVYINGLDATDDIRTPDASMAASDVSAIPAVRDAMAGMQREMATRMSVVMDGRDIGTNVLPHARHKFFLTASPDERARRRHADLLSRGNNTSLDEVLLGLIKRDEQDTTRAYVPLRPADDAVILDTSDMTQAQVVDHIRSIVEGAL